MQRPITPDEQAHLRVLKAFEKNPDLTQRELAKELGLSLGTVNYLVNALLDKGVIKMENFRRSDTKLKKIAYLLAPIGFGESLRLTQNYLARKKIEYAAIKAEIEALERESESANAAAAEVQKPR
jgi:EPS-associated MarR family transcriptional regulator